MIVKSKEGSRAKLFILYEKVTEMSTYRTIIYIINSTTARCLQYVNQIAQYKQNFIVRNNIKGTVMQIKKTLINDRLRISKYPENFGFQLFVILQEFTSQICISLEK